MLLYVNTLIVPDIPARERIVQQQEAALLLGVGEAQLLYLIFSFMFEIHGKAGLP